MESGALPAGTSLSTAGAITGTPTATGSFNFTVRATDGVGVAGTQACTLGVIVVPGAGVTGRGGGGGGCAAGAAGTGQSGALALWLLALAGLPLLRRRRQ